MRERTILTAGLLLCLLLSVSSAGDVRQAQEEIIALIKSGQMESAADNIDKFVAGYYQDPNLPGVLYEITRNYGWSNKYEEEKQVYQQIIQKYPDSLIASTARLGYAKAEIQSLIVSQKFDEAKAALDKLVADFSQHPDLPEALYWIARNYGWTNKYEEEKDTYQKLIQNRPDNYYSDKARLGCRRAEVLSLIVSQDYGQAGAALDKLIADFNSHPDLPDTLYWVARGYEWQDKYEYAKNIFEQIIEKYPGSSKFDNARLGISRMKACRLMISRQSRAGRDEVSKMITDFAGNPELPETLYWLARKCEWQDRYKDANDVYQQIMTNWPDSSYADRTKLDFQRAQIRALIASQDYNEADVSIDRFIDDFNGNPDLPEALYWIAQRYGYSGRFEDEQDLYQYIVENYPDSSYAAQAELDSAGAQVLSLIVTQNDNEANTALDKMVADFNGHSYLPGAMLFIARKCNEKGIMPDTKPELKNELLHFAAELLEKYVLGRIHGTDNKTQAYYTATLTNYKLGEAYKTIEFADMVLQTDPNFRYAANMAWLVADGYEKLKAADKIPADEADIIIEETYNDLMENYVGNTLSDYAAIHMGELNMKQGNNVKACAYFCWYLMNAGDEETDGRIARIKKLTEGCRCRDCGRNNND